RHPDHLAGVNRTLERTSQEGVRVRWPDHHVRPHGSDRHSRHPPAEQPSTRHLGGMATVTVRDRLTDALMVGMNLLHRAVLALTGGRIGWKLGPMTAVELHTVGRRSGKRRSTMLSAPISDDGRIVLVASKGGDDRHPQWYQNLVTNPEVELRVRDTTRRMRARTASPA